MRIAFIVGGFPKLSETFILNQITGLLKRGQEVDIYAHRQLTEPKTHPDIQNYHLLERTHYFPKVILNALNVLQFSTSAASLSLLSETSPFLGQRPYDIVHGHFGPNGNLALLLKETGALEGRVITTFYGYDISKYIQMKGKHVYNYLFKAGDLFLCISRRMEKDLLSLGCREEKIRMHRVGIDLSKFAFSRPQTKNHGKVQILSIARFVEKKGLQYGIHAVANLVRKYPYVNYTIIGDGPLKGSLSNLIESLKVGDNIKILGWMQQEEIVEWLYKADIFLAPSVTGQDGDQEGTPVVILEALARELPVLSTRHSGIPELIQNGESGMLIPERDLAALTHSLEYLIQHSEVWPEMGRKGRSYVERHHDIEKLNDRLVEIYQQVLSTHVD